MARGTYLIGETFISSLAPGESTINIRWDKAKFPPDTVIESGSPAHWQSLPVSSNCATGWAPTFGQVWDSSNLMQRNITIVGVGTDDSSDFAVAMVIGNENNSNNMAEIEIVRSKLPAGIRLNVEVTDTRAMEWIEKNQKQYVEEKRKHHCCELKILDDTKARISCNKGNTPFNIGLSLF